MDIIYLLIFQEYIGTEIALYYMTSSYRTAKIGKKLTTTLERTNKRFQK